MNVAMIRFRFGLRQRRDYYDDMRRFVATGKGEYLIVQKMIELYRHRPRLAWKVQMLRKIAHGMGSGKGFGEALAPFIPNEEATLLISADKSAKLKEGLASLTHLTSKRLEVSQALMKSLVPAGIVLTAAIAVMVIVMRMTLEQAVTMIPPRIMQGLTLAPAYFGTAEFLMGYGLFVLAGVIGLIFVVSRSLGRWKPGPLRSRLDHWVPPWSLFRRMQSAFTLVTSAAMLQAGINFERAVLSMRENAGPWLQMHLRRINQGLANGVPEVDALIQSRLLPEDASDRLAIYAESSQFDEVMNLVAADSMEMLVATVDRYGKTMNAIVLMAVGGFILVTLFAFGEIGLAIDPRAMQNEALNQ